MPPAWAIRGYAVASVLGWRALGNINFKQSKTRQPSTNPSYPDRYFWVMMHAFNLYFMY